MIYSKHILDAQSTFVIGGKLSIPNFTMSFIYSHIFKRIHLSNEFSFTDCKLVILVKKQSPARLLLSRNSTVYVWPNPGTRTSTPGELDVLRVVRLYTILQPKHDGCVKY